MSSARDPAGIERVEGLLASVQDAVATLQKLSSELEREVAHALYQNGPAVIEQAKGVIIARQGGSEEDAFAALTKIARREQVSVKDAAGAIIEAGARAHILLPEPEPETSAEVIEPAGSAAPMPVTTAGASREQVLGLVDSITVIEPLTVIEPAEAPATEPADAEPDISAEPAADADRETGAEPAAGAEPVAGAEPAAPTEAISHGEATADDHAGESEDIDLRSERTGATTPLHLSELIQRDDALEPGRPDQGRRRWRASPSHASNRNRPRFRSSAF